jgi:hypothetical protein
LFTAQQIDPVSGALTGSEVAHFRLKQLQVIFFVKTTCYRFSKRRSNYIA